MSRLLSCALGLIVLIQAAGCASSSPALPYEVVAQIRTGDSPHGIWFAPTGDKAYVACSGSDRIDIIDARRFEVIDMLPGGRVPLDVLGSADGRYLLVTQFQGSDLVKMRIGGGPMEQRWVVGEGGSLFSPRVIGDKAYLVCERSDTLVEFDRRTLQVTRTFATGDRPYPCSVTRDGRLAYVPNRGDGTVSVIDLQSGGTIRTVRVRSEPRGGALTIDDRQYLVAESGQDSVAAIYTATNELAGRVNAGVGPGPFSVVVTPDGTYAIINNAGGSTVSILDIDSMTILGDLETGVQPIVVRFHPDGRHVFVANEVSGTVTVLRRKPTNGQR